MITHAAYHAANPLPPLRGALIPAPVAEPPVGAGRVHRIASKADSAPNIVSTSDYIAALSKTEWRDSAYLSSVLYVDQPAAKVRMRGPVMSAITEVRRGARGQYEWRLK